MLKKNSFRNMVNNKGPSIDPCEIHISFQGDCYRMKQLLSVVYRNKDNPLKHFRNVSVHHK